MVFHLECADGSWGINCANVCDCDHSIGCDAITGECICMKGFWGPKCREGKDNLLKTDIKG